MAGRKTNPKTSQRTVSFTSKEIEKLPDDKPVVYRILTDGGRNNYTGIAQRGRVQDRLREHLAEGVLFYRPRGEPKGDVQFIPLWRICATEIIMGTPEEVKKKRKRSGAPD